MTEETVLKYSRGPHQLCWWAKGAGGSASRTQWTGHPADKERNIRDENASESVMFNGVPL